jgi:hypothetical protein
VKVLAFIAVYLGHNYTTVLNRRDNFREARHPGTTAYLPVAAALFLGRAVSRKNSEPRRIWYALVEAILTNWREPDATSSACAGLVQSAPLMHGLIVLALTNGNKPVEVSRLKLNDNYFSHWTAWDATTGRLVVTGNRARLYLVKLDQSTGTLTRDTTFHDLNGKPGLDFANRKWPHGWQGTGEPLGVVFSG